MREIIDEQFDAVLSEGIYGRSSGRRLILLAGLLGTEGLSENIREQLAKLSKLILLRDMFDALLTPINARMKLSASARIGADGRIESGAPDDLGPLIKQLDEVRSQMAECMDVNYAEILGWVSSQVMAQRASRRRAR